MPASFLLLLAAQFTSALADNALLIVTIDLLQQRAMPGWLAPMLKVAFIAAYVLLMAITAFFYLRKGSSLAGHRI